MPKQQKKWRSGLWWLRSLYLAVLAGIAGLLIYAVTQRADAPDLPASARTGQNTSVQ
jgi:hypothetical protein